MNIWIITSNLWEVMTWNFEVTGFLKYYFGAEVGKLWHMGQSQPATWYIYITLSAFLSLKGKKKSKTNIACHVKWYEIQVSLSIRKTLLEHEKNLLWYVIQVSFSINKSLLEHEKNLFFILFIFILLLLQRRQWHPTPVFLPGKSHGQRSLIGCSPWGHQSRTRLSDFAFTFHFHALEKEMATHSSVLAWRIPGTGKSGGLLSMGLHIVRHDWSDLAVSTFIIID